MFFRGIYKLIINRCMVEEFKKCPTCGAELTGVSEKFSPGEITSTQDNYSFGISYVNAKDVETKEVKEITNEESDTNPQTPNHKG